MPSIHISHSLQARISTAIIAFVCVFGMGGIIYASFQQSAPKPQVLGVSETYQASSETNQSSSTPQLVLPSSNRTELSEQSTLTEVLDQAYTNPAYPDFLLKYPSSWQFSTTTSRSNYEGLANRTLTLRKNETEIIMNIILAVPTDCYPSGNPQLQKTLSNGLSRYSIESTNTSPSIIFYGVTNEVVGRCSYTQNKLNSITQSELFTATMGKKQVYAGVSIELKSGNNQNYDDVDAIIEHLQTSATTR